MSTKSTASKALTKARELAAARLCDIKAQEERIMGLERGMESLISDHTDENETYLAQLDDRDKTLQGLWTQETERLREIKKLKEQVAIAVRYHGTLQTTITNMAKAASNNSSIATALVNEMTVAAREAFK